MSKIPKLRFKEFSNEWEEKNILDISTMKARIGWQNLRQDEHLEKGEYYLVTGTDFKLEKIDWNNAKYVEYDRYIQDKNIILQEGDILITKDGSIGKLAYVENIKDRKATLNNGIFRIRVTDNNTKFVYFTFLSRRFKIFLYKLSGGSSIKHLYQKDFQTYSIALPSKHEQEKIATFLTLVDTKIEQLTKKEEFLALYKTGVMQKIFSGDIRFKADDGSEFPKWKETSLKKIFKERKLSATKSEGYEHISLTTEGVVPKSKRYERDFLVNDDSSKKYKVTKLNDICYNPANLKFGVIARNKYADGIFSPIYVTFEVVDANIKFIEYFVTRWDFINKVRKYEEGTVYERQAVKPQDFLKFSIAIPIIKEQTKIANFLSSIDTKIEQAQKQLDATKEFKKALLQQMFI